MQQGAGGNEWSPEQWALSFVVEGTWHRYAIYANSNLYDQIISGILLFLIYYFSMELLAYFSK